MTSFSKTAEDRLAKKAEELCPICLGVSQCALETKGWRPKFDQEDSLLCGHNVYCWSQCDQLQKQIQREQVKQYISEKFQDRTFEKFSITAENKDAFDTCWNYAQNFSWSTKDGLILSGPVGTGKTYLASAILGVVLNRTIPSAMVIIPQLLEEIRQSYGDDTVEKRLAEKVMRKRFLVLDDFGAEKSTEWVREQLYHLINHRYENNLPTVITTNLDGDELKDKHGERIVDRIVEMCQGVKLEGPSYRGKIRKQKNKAV